MENHNNSPGKNKKAPSAGSVGGVNEVKGKDRDNQYSGNTGALPKISIELAQGSPPESHTLQGIKNTYELLNNSENKADRPDPEPAKKKTYCQDRLDQLGITDEQNTISGTNANLAPQTYKFFNPTDHDDILISYFHPDGSLIHYDKKGKLVPFTRKRLNPQNVARNKYYQETKSGVHLFCTPRIIRKFKAKQKINNLFIVEGEFKAMAGSSVILDSGPVGLDIVGIGGIHSFKDKNTGELLADLQEIIKICQVTNIIFLMDADCLDVEYEEGKDLYKRPNMFYSSIKTAKELTEHLGINVYFSHIKSEFSTKAKGLDDLLIMPGVNKTTLLTELENLSVGSSSNRKYIKCINISANSFMKLRQYFYIDNVTSFYKKYKDVLELDGKKFVDERDEYIGKGEKVELSSFEKAEQYARIGTDFYKKVPTVDAHGNREEILKKWKIGAINLDCFHNKKFIQHIPKYDKFINFPDNSSNYHQSISVNDEETGFTSELYNCYRRITHIPKAGSWPNIEKYLRHLFSYKNLKGEVLYDFGLDYIQMLYLHPKQRLPVLCFVSVEINTGKSTFSELLRAIFKENVVVLDNERLGSKFTAPYAEKLIIIVDEAVIKAEQPIVKERLKNFATGKKQWSESKGIDPEQIDYFGKLILLSNNETNFLQIDVGDNRFAVIKVPVLKEGEDDPFLIDKMIPEISAFLHALINRPFHYAIDKSRLAFADDVYDTELKKDVISRMASSVEKEIKQFLKEMFIITKQEQLEYTPSDLFDIINERIAFKISRMRIIDYLKLEIRLKPKDKVVRYTKYTPNPDSLDVKHAWKEDSKTGMPYTFAYKNWLAPDELEDFENKIFL
jgi:hypothetical protein